MTPEEKLARLQRLKALRAQSQTQPAPATAPPPSANPNHTQLQGVQASYTQEDFLKNFKGVGRDIAGGLRDLLPDYRREEGEGHNLGNIDPGQIVGGIRDAAQGVLTLGNSADNFVANKLGYLPAITAGNGEPGFQLGDLVPRIVNKKDAPESAQLPQVQRSEHLTGNLGRGIAQYATGYAGASRALPSAINKLPTAVRGIAKGGVGEFFAFDGNTPRLSDMAPEGFGGAAAPVIDALRTREGDGEVAGRLKNVAEGGILGAGIEAGIAGVRAGARVARGGDLRPHASGIARSDIRNAPDIDELRTRRDQAYDAAGQSGARYSDDGFVDTVGRIEQRLSADHFDARTHGPTAGVVRKLHEFVGDSPTLQQLESLRQRVSRDLLSPKPGAAVSGSDQHFGRAIVEEIDGLIGREGAIVSGAADDTLQTIRTARDSHAVLKRSELIDEAMTRAHDRAGASGSGGNLENAMRGEIRRILHSDKLRHGFSEAEVTEMRKFVRGGTLQNILRGYGKLSPVGSGLMAAIGTGSAATNPGTLPIFLGAIGSRALADRGSRKAATRIGELVRSRPVGPEATRRRGMFGSGRRRAGADAGAAPADFNAPVGNGFASAGAAPVVGAGAGAAIAPDLDGDGAISARDRAGGALGGATLVGGLKAYRRFRSAADAKVPYLAPKDDLGEYIRRAEAAAPERTGRAGRQPTEDDVIRAHEEASVRIRDWHSNPDILRDSEEARRLHAQLTQVMLREDGFDPRAFFAEEKRELVEYLEKVPADYAEQARGVDAPPRPTGQVGGPVDRQFDLNAWDPPTENGFASRGLTRPIDKVALLGGLGAVAGGTEAQQAQLPEEQSTQEIGQLGQRIDGLETSVTQYEQELAGFAQMSVAEKQAYLRDNYGQLIPVDGQMGPQTASAIEAFKSDLSGRRQTTVDELESARNRRNDLEIQIANQENKPGNPYLQKGAAAAAGILGAYGAHKFRGRNLRHAAQAARGTEDRANALIAGAPVPTEAPRRTLLSRLPVVGRGERDRIASETEAAQRTARETEDRLTAKKPRRFTQTGQNSVEARAASLNEYYALGGAGDDVPFRLDADGQYHPKKRGVARESSLFRPQGPLGRIIEPLRGSVRSGDVAATAGGGVEAGMMQPIIESARADKKKASEDLARAQEARDAVGIAEAKDRINKAAQIENLALTAQRVGLGFAGGGLLGTFHGRYATPRPRAEAASRERALTSQELAKRAASGALSNLPAGAPPVSRRRLSLVSPANDR